METLKMFVWRNICTTLLKLRQKNLSSF